MSGGPNYESVAELRMFSMLGVMMMTMMTMMMMMIMMTLQVDCVGMSSIPECLTAHHANMAVLAFCLVTNQVDVVVANIFSLESTKYP